MPKKHEDLPECLEKPQSPDLPRGKISPSPEESRRERAERANKNVRLISICYFLIFRDADLLHLV